MGTGMVDESMAATAAAPGMPHLMRTGRMTSFHLDQIV